MYGLQVTVPCSTPIVWNVTDEAPRRRLRPEVRRELLLDAAAELLFERGVGGITMEGVAARAGVNKALPYRHFENADDVLVQLYIRFARQLAARVLGAIEANDDVERRVAATVSAYLDVVSDHRALLAIALVPGSGVADRGNEELNAPSFVADLMVEHFGVPRKLAASTGDVVLGILAAAAQSWGSRSVSRRKVEALASGAILGILSTAHG